MYTKSFSTLVRESGMSTVAIANKAMISRQQLFNYQVGKVNPCRVSYQHCHSLGYALSVPAHEVFCAIENSYYDRQARLIEV